MTRAAGWLLPVSRSSGDKDNLLAGDQAWDEITVPDLTVNDWRTAATHTATDQWTVQCRLTKGLTGKYRLA
jgi:hypothetical protein